MNLMDAPSRIDAARSLAARHVQSDDAVREVFLMQPAVNNGSRSMIVLLEVVDGTSGKEIFPVQFNPDAENGIPYTSVVIDVSPKHFDSLNGSPIQYKGHEWRIGPSLARR